MDILAELNKEFFNQSFVVSGDDTTVLAEYKFVARMYSEMENAIAVLSDLHMRCSYVYYGGLARLLGIDCCGTCHNIDTVWENDLLGRVLPSDLVAKRAYELRFFHMLRKMDRSLRRNYYMKCGLRLCGTEGMIVRVWHRIFYVASHADGSIWLALCLYVPDESAVEGCVFVDSLTGRSVPADGYPCDNMLSRREVQVLKLISQGLQSKDISDKLSISINTVSRHRQNILHKLQAVNSVDACRLARELKLI